MRELLTIVLVLLLAGCGRGLDDTYGDTLGMARYAFQSDGKVTITVMGQSQQTTYLREKDVVTLMVPGEERASLEFTINPDGSLQGPMGMRLEKIQD